MHHTFHDFWFKESLFLYLVSLLITTDLTRIYERTESDGVSFISIKQISILYFEITTVTLSTHVPVLLIKLFKHNEITKT